MSTFIENQNWKSIQQNLNFSANDQKFIISRNFTIRTFEINYNTSFNKSKITLNQMDKNHINNIANYSL